jgi:hypothetical protein
VEQEIEALVGRLLAADDDEREEIKVRLVELIKGPGGAGARELIENAGKGQVRTAPPKPAPKAAAPPPPEPPPQAPKPGQRLTAKDLEIVYQDPRGLVLHKTKVGDRWFATQMNPQTRQPETFELHPSEVAEIKVQLASSPYWVVGGGGLATS